MPLSAWFAPLTTMPHDVAAPGARDPLYDTEFAVTAWPDCVAVTFQEFAIVCDPAKENRTAQFDVATVPVLVTVKASW